MQQFLRKKFKFCKFLLEPAPILIYIQRQFYIVFVPAFHYNSLLLYNRMRDEGIYRKVNRFRSLWINIFAGASVFYFYIWKFTTPAKNAFFGYLWYAFKYIFHLDLKLKIEEILAIELIPSNFGNCSVEANFIFWDIRGQFIVKGVHRLVEPLLNFKLNSFTRLQGQISPNQFITW